jgi:hypothetical protein
LGATMFRVPLADIAYIEVGKLDFWKTTFAVVGGHFGSMIAIVTLGRLGG